MLSYIAVYNCDTYVHVSSASVSISFFMLINQYLCLEIAIRKFFNNGYGKYRNHHSVNSINVAENDLANSVNAGKNYWTDWQFSVSRGELRHFQGRSKFFLLKIDKGSRN